MKAKGNRPASLPRDPGARRIAVLGIISCAGIALSAAALVLTWRISGDLQTETVAAAAVLILILAGIGALALRGGEKTALWIVSTLVFVLTAADLYFYGIHSSMASAFLLPILLLGGGWGIRAGLCAASVCSVSVWLLAAGENAGWIAVPYEQDISHLTFDAPALTVIYLLCAVVAGYAVDSLRRSNAEAPSGRGEES